MYIKPTNSELDSNGQPISITPSDETDYMPDPDKHAVVIILKIILEFATARTFCCST